MADVVGGTPDDGHVQGPQPRHDKRAEHRHLAEQGEAARPIDGHPCPLPQGSDR